MKIKIFYLIIFIAFILQLSWCAYDIRNRVKDRAFEKERRHEKENFELEILKEKLKKLKELEK